MSSDDTLIRAYLTSELSEEQRDEFEVALLEDPELYERVYFESKLRDGMSLAATNNITPVNESTPPSILSKIKAMVEQPAWSYAATGVAALLLLALAVQQPSAPEIGKIVYVDALRSEQAMDIVLPPDIQTLIVIDTFEALDNISAAQVLQGETVMQQLTSLAPTADAQVNLVLNGLDAGDYTLEITTDATNRQIPISVVKD